jgi:carbon storage regulator
MLVLSRKNNERILIGPSIVLTVVRIEGSKVRLGIEAPPDVEIVREELLLPRSETGGR